MVKIQKPLPKSMAKPANIQGIKKEKPAKENKAIPASNPTAKKAKTKLIEKSIQELKSVKPIKNVVKQEAAQDKKGGKNKQKKNKVKQEVSPKKDNTTTPPPPPPTTKKSVAKAGSDVRKPAPQKSIPAQKKANTENKAQQQQQGKKQKKNTENKPQSQTGKNQKKDAKDAAKPEQKLNKNQKDKEEEKSATKFEAQPFDEEQFNKVVNLENIKKISKALKKLVETEVSEKKTSIFSDYRYFLNVCSYKIPNVPKRIVKLNLKHSLVNPEEDDVVIIVPDLQRGAKVDYEPTIQHYEDLLREAGVTKLKIVPFNQIRKECTTFEAKRKFANTYDYFLCDGRIVGHVVGFCGSPFQKPRTTFHAVRLNKSDNYKQEIERSLKRTAYRQLVKGDLISIPVGNHRHSINELAENIQFVIDQLKTIYPGGLANVRQMNLKIDIIGTSSIPLYANLAGPPLETPNVVGLREQRMLKLKKEANEVLEQFNLSKTGEFVKLDKEQVQRKRQIQDARKALVNDLVIQAEDEIEEIPAKKVKKDTKEKQIVTKEDEDVEKEGEDDDDEEGEENDEEEQEDDDDEEEDDDEDEDEDDDEEEDDDE